MLRFLLLPPPRVIIPESSTGAAMRLRHVGSHMIILEPCNRGRSVRAPAEELLPEAADLYALCLALGALGALLIGWSQHVVQRPHELVLFGLLAAAAGTQKLWVPNSPASRV